MNPVELWILKTLGALLITSSVVAVSKGLRSLREIKTNHLPHLQAAVEAIPPALEKQSQAFEKVMERQSDAMVGALSDIKGEILEQRRDIRQLTAKL